MFHIVYASKATIVFSPDLLTSLLISARARNEANDVSGMLVFCAGQFLQVLEGEARAVTATFDRITRDGRHADLKVLFRGQSHLARLFGSWTMGFHHAVHPGDLPQGIISVSDRIDLSRLDHLTAVDFLTACQPTYT